jgi:murein L,D-transpeptidase YcbB/YkuD
MTTKANPQMVAAVPLWEAQYASAVFSGIVGDQAHQASGGYHISIENQPATNYSVTRGDDKAPPGNWARDEAAALDMSMAKADMVASTRRWMAVWSDRADPRRVYFNAFNGWVGSGNAQRWDMVTNSVGTATNDHQWHQHTEWRRRFVNDPMSYLAMDSINKGESKETWIAAHGGAVIPPTPKPPVKTVWRKGDIDGDGTVRHIQQFYHDVFPAYRWTIKYKPGQMIGVDGNYEDQTAAWVTEFQKRTGLSQDGETGPNTFAMMRRYGYRY